MDWPIFSSSISFDIAFTFNQIDQKMAALQASDKCSHTHVCCALSIGLRLALEPDLRL
jgi:hypothetical protein